MKKTPLLVASAMAAVLSMPLGLNAQSGPAPKPKFEAEKCYGVEGGQERLPDGEFVVCWHLQA